MSEPDNPRWLKDVSDELRQEVPVRAAWRARLIDDIARSRQPVAGDDFDDREIEVTGSRSVRTRGRRIVISPVTGIAAALLFAAVGAGAAIATLSWQARTTRDGSTNLASGENSTAQSSVASVSNGGQTVQFELAAPKASHVALVGSFNEWNPVATPLRRDPATGKWIVSLVLSPGRHVYSFVVDGDVTADPTAPRAADADFGSANSVVFVAGGRSS